MQMRLQYEIWYVLRRVQKKTLERLQGELPESSLSDLYSNYLFAWLYPEEYEVV